MNLIEEYILKNKRIFDKKVEYIKQETNVNKKLISVKKLVRFSVFNEIPYFSSADLENELLSISDSIESSDTLNDYEKNSVLHVMTEAKQYGGHTRVVERWIEKSPDNQKHSVILTDQILKKQIPKELQNNVNKKNGQIFDLSYIKDFIDKAKKLREIASKYEYIILHINMDDIIPILAFGTVKFKRPIAFYNHADHLFWLGVSISDLVINLRTVAVNINKKYRKTINDILIPLPVTCGADKKNNRSDDDIKTIKKELGIPINNKVIITMASPYKYNPIDNYNFIETVKKIFSKVDNVTLLAIGPSVKNKIWKVAKKDTNNRILPIGYVDNSKLDKYLKIADIAFDSFPYSSFLSLLDISQYNIPCLSLKTLVFELDSFIEANIYCNTQEEFIDKAVKLLQSNCVNSDSSLYKILLKYHSADTFKANLEYVYNIFPKEHKLNIFTNDNNIEISKFKQFICKINISKNDTKTKLEKFLKQRKDNKLIRLLYIFFNKLKG